MAGDAEGDVQAFAQQVDAALGEKKLVANGRVLRLEAGEQRGKHVPTKAGGGADAQGAVELVARLAQREPRALGGVAHRTGACMKTPARFGEPQAARAARKERHAHRGLDRRDTPADRRSRQPQLTPSLRKAAGLGNAREELQRIRVESLLGDGLPAAADGRGMSGLCRHSVDDVAPKSNLPAQK